MKMHARKRDSSCLPAILAMVGALFAASAMADVVKPPPTEDPVVEEPDTTTQDTTAQDTTAQDTVSQDTTAQDTTEQDPVVEPEPEPIPEPEPEPIVEPEVDWSAAHLKFNFGSSMPVEGWIDGEFFSSDNGNNFTFFSLGEPKGLPNEAAPEIYQTVRHRPAPKAEEEGGEPPENPPLYFIFPKVPDGEYLIRIHTTDMFGSRAIDIYIEGEKVFEDIDPMTEGGGSMAPVIKEYVVHVSGGLDIMMDDDREEVVNGNDVFLSALEIIRGGKISGIRAPFAVSPHSGNVAGYSIDRTDTGLRITFGAAHSFTVTDAAGRYVAGSRFNGERCYALDRGKLNPGFYLMKATVAGRKISRIMVIR